MHKAMPPLSALRAFEAAARHLSFTLAAQELHVTPGALSHQVRGLEDFLGVQLFERRTRAIALTAQGRRLYPGLQAGFTLLRDAVASLQGQQDEHVLVLSTSPGLTSKWLASRLHRFADAHPDIEVRISSSVSMASFQGDGVDAAIRNVALPLVQDDVLHMTPLVEILYAPVCSPALTQRFGRMDKPGVLAMLPLIHDDSLEGRPGVPDWKEWATAAGMDVGDLRRGLHFNSGDHALDAVLQGQGILLSPLILAHDDLRNGRLVMPFPVVLPAQRAYVYAYPKAHARRRKVQAFGAWLQDEFSRLALPGLPARPASKKKSQRGDGSRRQRAQQ